MLILLAALFCFAQPTIAAEQDESLTQVLRGEVYQLTYAGSERLPNFEIDGKLARIHTQGIYVTGRSLYVTGRLEHNPKRALFLRFDRQDLKLAESVDLTPLAQLKGSGELRDHPGGFDYDGLCFWIPVAVSRHRSKASIVKVCTKLDSDLTLASTEVAFVVDDHIGALAFNCQKKLLYGANWDTKRIYLWNPDGMLIKRTPREELLQEDPGWALAVQDWKGLAEGVLVAGGMDKSDHLEASQSRAVVQWIDVARQRILDSIRLPKPTSDAHRQTREGMTFFDQQLFLLPGDLGEDAVLYRYRVQLLDK